jgi:hypothetical protein
MSYGFGAFLDGLVGGMDRRRTWDRQDTAMKWDAQDREIAMEDRARRIAIEDENADWTRTQRDRQRTLWSREDELSNALADVYSGAGAGSAAPSGGVQPPAPTPTPQPSPDLAIPVPENTGTIERSTLPESPAAPAIDAPAQTRPQPRPEGAGRQIAAPTEAVPGSTPEPGTGGTPAAAASQAPQQGYAATMRAAGINDANMLQAAEAADMARAALQAGIYPNTQEPLTPEATQQLQGIIAQADRALAATLEEAASAQQTTGAPQGGPRGAAPSEGAPAAAPAPAGRTITATTPAPGNGAPASAAAPTGPAAPLATAPQTPPASGGGASGTWGAAQAGTPAAAAATPDGRIPENAPAPRVEDVANPSSPEAAAQADQAAQQAAAELPSSQEAAESAQETARQITVDGQTFTVEDVNEDNLSTAGTNFQSRYNRDGVERVIQAYIRAGRPEDAQAFRQFVQDEETQQAIVHFGRAIFAASAGDADQFLIEMSKIYNTERYYDDGYTVVLDDSEILRDEAGNFAGSRIAFRNDESGEVFMREIMDEDDFYSIAAGLAAPETVFQNWMQEYSAAREARAAEAEAFREANRIQPQTMAERREDFDQMWEFLFEQAGEVDPFNPPEEGAPPNFRQMSPQEQARLVLEQLEARDAGLSGRSINPSFGGGASRGDVPVATAP